MTETDQQNWFMQVYGMLGSLLPMDDQVEGCRRFFADKTFARPMDGMAIIGPRRDVMAMGSKDNPFSVQGAVDYGQERPMIPLGIDPPEHAAYRRLLDHLFAPKRLDILQDEIVQRADNLIDQFIDEGRTDYTETFAVPFPSSVFLDLMGLPQDDVPLLVRLKDDCFHPGGGTVSDPAEIARIQRQGARDFYDYFAEAITDRRRAPKENDLISGLLEVEIDGRPLSEEEMLDICYTLALGGLDTVTATLTMMMAYLAEHDDQRTRILDDPSVIPGAVEELLRWTTPAPYLFRVASGETDLGGCPINRGDMVFGSMAGANLDADEFPNPYTVDFDRSPNRHVTFGPGYHRCLGSHLARRELQIALRQWHARIPRYAVTPETDLTIPMGPLRMVKHLHLTW